MRKVAFGMLALALLVTVSADVSAESARTLNGGFVWNNENQTGDLKAVFTEQGENKWGVAFHFTWEGEPHIYAGTAEGNLSTGELKGEVENDSEERKTTFYFKGNFDEGIFTGNHWVVGRDGNDRDTGTLTLR